MTDDTQTSSSPAKPNSHANDLSPTPYYETFSQEYTGPSRPSPPKQVRFIDALKTVRWEDFSKVHMYPCVRESGLTGIGMGFGVGGMTALLGASIPRATSWAAASIAIGAVASYEFCMYRRQLERQLAKQAVEIMDAKKAEKKKLLEKRRQEIREEREREAEEERKKKRWWRW